MSYFQKQVVLDYLEKLTFSISYILEKKILKNMILMEIELFQLMNEQMIYI